MKKVKVNSTNNIFIWLLVIFQIILIGISQFIDNFSLSIIAIILPLIIIVINRPKLFLYLFVALYPILPDYFRIPKINIPMYIILVVIFNVYFILFYKNRNLLEIFNDKQYRKNFIIYIFINIILYTIHLEIIPTIYFLLEFLLLSIVIYSLINTREQFYKLIDILIIVATVLCIFGIVERVFQFNIFSLIENYQHTSVLMGSAPYIRFGKIRIEQSFNHSITYCLYLLFLSSLVFYRLQVCSKNRRKYYYISGSLIIINSFLTMSRAPMIAVMANLVVLFIFIEKNKRKKIMFSALICILIIFIFDYLVGGKILNQLKQPFYMLMALFNDKYKLLIENSFGDNADPFHYRIALFNNIIGVIKDKEWGGIGASQPISFVYYSELTGQSSIKSSVDNNYLWVLAKYGIVGIVNYCMYYFEVLIYSIRNFRRRFKDEYNFNIIFISTMIFYLSTLITVAEMQEKKIAIIFIILMLIYNKIIRIENKNTDGFKE